MAKDTTSTIPGPPVMLAVIVGDVSYTISASEFYGQASDEGTMTPTGRLPDGPELQELPLPEKYLTVDEPREFYDINLEPIERRLLAGLHLSEYSRFTGRGPKRPKQRRLLKGRP